MEHAVRALSVPSFSPSPSFAAPRKPDRNRFPEKKRGLYGISSLDGYRTPCVPKTTDVRALEGRHLNAEDDSVRREGKCAVATEKVTDYP